MADRSRCAGGIARRVVIVLCAALAAVTSACGTCAAASRAAAAPTQPLSISVVGNQFVDGAGQPVRLLGVDRAGTESACVKGTGYATGPLDAGEAAAIAAWHADAVRVLVNEDCWLGINGLPAYGTAAGYRQAIEDDVRDLGAAGLYAIIDLQWSAPGATPATGVAPMPDDHSVAFWQSAATAFLDDPAVVFDAFNEPQVGGLKDPDAYWPCWRDGGCTATFRQGAVTPVSYTAVGLQALVDAIRSTGATQPILLSGQARGNDLTGWESYEPRDPDGQLAAAIHIYASDPCATASCWTSTVSPVAAQVPVTISEFGDKDCSAGLDDSVMGWGDAHGVGYLAWAWSTASASCHMLALIANWSGTPRAPNGTALHDHLSALAAGPLAAPFEQP